jgi:hypothetical protein
MMEAKKVNVDVNDFLMAFENNQSSAEDPVLAYLDLTTGKSIYFYEEDDTAANFGLDVAQNDETRERVFSNLDKYLEIPRTKYEDDRKSLEAFLDSDWTNDEDKWRFARRCYSGAIGRWKKSVNDRDTVHAYYEFCEERNFERAREFLRENGIEADLGESPVKRRKRLQDEK